MSAQLRLILNGILVVSQHLWGQRRVEVWSIMVMSVTDLLFYRQAGRARRRGSRRAAIEYYASRSEEGSTRASLSCFATAVPCIKTI